MMDGIDSRVGSVAVGFARDTIERYLRDDPKPEPPTDTATLTEDRGAFVTLESNGDLRGCIGRPYPRQPGHEAVRRGAVGAATEDPRFPPLTREEVSHITVEVSLLGTPEPVSPEPDRSDPGVEVGRDGLIVNAGGNSGLLLPQVAIEHGWSVEEFLEQTCRKARLPRDCWRDDDVEIQRFTAAVFAETEPAGDVRPVQLEEALLG